MSDDGDDEGLHGGSVTAFFGGVPVCTVPVRDHRPGECEQVREEAVQSMFGHETTFEADDAAAVRSASVGYSRSYADNFDAAFGRN